MQSAVHIIRCSGGVIHVIYSTTTIVIIALVHKRLHFSLFSLSADKSFHFKEVAVRIPALTRRMIIKIIT